MQLSYGGYAFAANSVNISRTVEKLWNEGGQCYAERITLDVSGTLDGDGQSGLTTAIQALESALSIPYQDLTFAHDDGSTSAILLRNSGSISGVQIMRGPTLPTTQRANYATMMEFSFSASAEYPVNGSGNALLSWTETVELWGGGPLRDVFPCTNAPPQEQQIWPMMPYEAVQRGTIVGYLAYPPVPPPYAPNKMTQGARVSRRAPKRRGNGFTEFPVDYAYTYKSSTPLDALPLLWMS